MKKYFFNVKVLSTASYWQYIICLILNLLGEKYTFLDHLCIVKIECQIKDIFYSDYAWDQKFSYWKYCDGLAGALL